MIEVLIPTCDKYIKYTEALMITSRNIWPEGFQFRILGFKEPKFKLDSNWSFTKIGNKDEGPKSWGNGLKWFFTNYQHEHFIYGSDDCALTFVNKEAIERAIHLCQIDKFAGRFSLTADKPEKKYFHLEGDEHYGLNVYAYADGINYRLSLGWSIYNTKFFNGFLKSNMTPWEYEKQSCGELNIFPYNIYTYHPFSCIDAAYFCRKDKGLIEDWDKGYYGTNLEAEMKEKVQQIIFSK